MAMKKVDRERTRIPSIESTSAEDAEVVLTRKPETLKWLPGPVSRDPFAPPSRYRTIQSVTTYGAYEDPL